MKKFCHPLLGVAFHLGVLFSITNPSFAVEQTYQHSEELNILGLAEQGPRKLTFSYFQSLMECISHSPQKYKIASQLIKRLSNIQSIAWSNILTALQVQEEMTAEESEAVLDLQVKFERLQIKRAMRVDFREANRYFLIQNSCDQSLWWTKDDYKMFRKINEKFARFFEEFRQEYKLYKMNWPVDSLFLEEFTKFKEENGLSDSDFDD